MSSLRKRRRWWSRGSAGGGTVAAPGGGLASAAMATPKIELGFGVLRQGGFIGSGLEEVKGVVGDRHRVGGVAERRGRARGAELAEDEEAEEREA
jgi:hypothetical protein